MENYYAVLGVPHDAAAKQIKDSYRKLALTTHPDKNPSSTATAEFQLLGRAFDELKDSQKRARYDVGWQVQFGAKVSSNAADRPKDPTTAFTGSSAPANGGGFKPGHPQGSGARSEYTKTYTTASMDTQTDTSGARWRGNRTPRRSEYPQGGSHESTSAGRNPSGGEGSSAGPSFSKENDPPVFDQGMFNSWRFSELFKYTTRLRAWEVMVHRQRTSISLRTAAVDDFQDQLDRRTMNMMNWVNVRIEDERRSWPGGETNFLKFIEEKINREPAAQYFLKEERRLNELIKEHKETISGLLDELNIARYRFESSEHMIVNSCAKEGIRILSTSAPLDQSVLAKLVERSKGYWRELEGVEDTTNSMVSIGVENVQIFCITSWTHEISNLYLRGIDPEYCSKCTGTESTLKRCRRCRATICSRCSETIHLRKKFVYWLENRSPSNLFGIGPSPP